MKHLIKTLLVTLCMIFSLDLHANEPQLIWTPEAMLRMKFISDVQLSPDNRSALFVVSEPKITGDKGEILTRIYKANCMGHMERWWKGF